MNGAFAATLLVFAILAQLAVFITHEFSVDLFLKAVTGIAPPTVMLVKYFIFVWNMDQVKYVFEWIQNDYDSLTNERELRLIEKFADQGTNISKSILYCSLLTFVFIGLTFLPVLCNIGVNQPRSLLIPIDVEYFVDQGRYVFWIVLHINTSVVLGVCIMIVTESTIIHFSTHASGIIEIVGDRVERVLENMILNALRGKTYLSIYGQLVATVKLHQRVLKFIEYLNSTLLSHYCIIIAVGVVSLSVNLYIVAKAMLLKKVTGETVTALMLGIVEFFYMGCGNYVGQILLDKGNDLFTRTYYARWHEAPLPVQKVLLYIRQRSMKPTGFKFGGLYTGSLELFSKMVNASISYFTVLYSTA